MRASGTPRSATPFRRLGSLLAVILASAACTASSVEPADDLVTVTGTVTDIVDETPVDGGVTLSLVRARGGEETLFFGSLFTSPPPGPERLALYDRVKRARVGSRVRASGRRGEAGIELTDFVVLLR